jgi:hypothetical protein
MAIAIILGDTYNNKEEIKTLGFQFNFDHKVFWKMVNDEVYKTLEVMIEAKFPKCRAYWIQSLDNVRECKEYDLEYYRTEVLKNKKSNNASEAIDSNYSGKVIEVSKWYSKVFKQNNNSSYEFRNMKVLAVYRETDKAIQADVEYYGGIACRCGVCGRQLDNAISLATGIGPVCAEKIGLPRPSLENAQVIVEQLKALSKKQGIFKGVWIPKSQIKEVIGGSEC